MGIPYAYLSPAPTFPHIHPIMQALPFILVIATGIVVMLISYVLDYLWAQVLPLRFFYYLVRAPGVIVHECSHILGCLLTGAKITDVVFFSDKGGSVTYTRPKIPFLGDLVISTAPLFCIPLVLYGLTWCFSQYLGCTIPAIGGLPSAIDSSGTLQLLALAVVDLFWQNLVAGFHPWFLLYVYLTLSLVLSMAPSGQDLRNAAIGIGLLTLAGLLVFFSNIPFAIDLLWQVMSILGMGFVLGFTFSLVACALSLPAIAWYLLARRHLVP
jgi:hypothetical protein